MKLDKSLEPFRAAIESLQRLLHKFNDRGVIIGGVAVVFWTNRDLLPISMLFSCFLQREKSCMNELTKDWVDKVKAFKIHMFLTLLGNSQ